MRLLPLIRQLSVIEKKTSALLPFPIDAPKDSDEDFAWAQRAVVTEIERQYNSRRPVRIIVLKARQLGISTVSEAIMFLWAMLHDNMQGLVLAHENDTTQSLFEKTQLYWETWPWRHFLEAKHSTQRRLVWSNGSSIRTATARNLGAGRGRTIHALHTSECASYIDPETLMGGLRQSLPEEHGTIEIVESTAAGVGNWFHHEWQRAVEEDSSYVPLFFPWFKHYEYRTSDANCHIAREAELDEEEKRLYRLGASFRHLQWRRNIIPDKLHYDEDFFRQEYPATPEEAFLTSGDNVFNQSHVRDAYVPVGTQLPDGRVVSAGQGDLHSPDGYTHPRFLSAPDGKLVIYRAPSRRPDSRLYMIAVDPTRTTYGDPACIQVLNRATGEQVAVWHGNYDPNDLAKEVSKIGRWYHDAEVIVEVGGGGAGVISLLLDWGYPNLWTHRRADHRKEEKSNPVYGFLSSYQYKSWAIGNMQYLLGQGFLTIHDPVTFHQMQNYTQLGDWDTGNADAGGHDDAVMAMILACHAHLTEPIYQPPEFRMDEPALELYAPHGA